MFPASVRDRLRGVAEAMFEAMVVGGDLERGGKKADMVVERAVVAGTEGG